MPVYNDSAPDICCNCGFNYIVKEKEGRLVSFLSKLNAIFVER